MRTLAKAAVVFVAAFAGGAAVSHAADIPYEPIIEAPEVIPLPAVGGWYLRGDIGYKVYQDPRITLADPAAGTASGESINNTGMVGVGVGYKFNDYFRADLTGDYEFRSTMKVTNTCAACGTPVITANTKFSAFTTLVNAYADLGTYSGITPYLGAGIGASYLKTSNINTSIGPAGSGDGQWNFAWALMAGASYAFTDRLALDVNYRYLNLGEASLGTVTTQCGCTTTAKTDKIDAHEIRVGLRYSMY